MHALRKLVGVFALTPVMLAHAGPFEIHRLNVRDGSSAVWISGELPAMPVALFYDNDYYLVDQCGAVYGIGQDVFGEMSVQALADYGQPLAGFGNYASSRSNRYATDGDGRLYTLRFDADTRRREAEAFAFDRTIEGGEHHAVVSRFFPTLESKPPFALTRDGKLLVTALSGSRVSGLRKVAGEWSDVLAGIEATARWDRVAPASYLFTAHEDGRLDRSEIKVDFGGDVAIDRKTLYATGFADTAALLGTYMEGAKTWLYRLTTNGEVRKTSLDGGQELSVFKLPHATDVQLMRGLEIYLVSANPDDFQAACPVAKLEAVLVETGTGPETARAVELIRELNATLATLKPGFERVAAAAEKRYSDFEDDASREAHFEQALQDVEAFSAGDLANAKALLKELDDSYGGYNAAYTADVREQLNGEFQFMDAGNELQDMLEEFDEYVAAMAGTFLSEARLQNTMASVMDEDDYERRIEQYGLAATAAEWVLRFDPVNEEAKEIIAARDALQQGEKEQMSAALESAVWPDHYASFQGPGDPDDLAEAALKYFRDRQDGSPGVEYLAVRVRDDWIVGERNLVNDPLNYCLPIFIAASMPESPDLAKVMEGEVCTRDAVRKPPFGVRAFSTRSYRMYRDRIDTNDSRF